MGQTPSNPTIATPSITRYSPKYHVIETKQDPHYGEVKIIVEDETKERQILKEISFTSQAAFDKELDFFTQRVQVSDPNIAGILGFSSENDNNVSPHLFTIKIFIELVDKDLQQELQERIQANKFFSESELLFICEGIISALYHLERQGFSHGDIRPFNIFASPKGYKLFDPSLSSQRNHNGFIKTLKNDLQAFLCPELLAQVPERDQEIKCNKFKADVFSLGVTILSLASLTHGEDLYNYQTGVIKHKLLQERLDVVKHHYSMFTHDLIKDMLAEEESERPNFKALHTKLLPYEDNIRQKTDLPFFKKKQNLSQGQAESSVPKEKLPEKTESTNLTKAEEAPKDPISGHQVEYTRKPTGSEPEEHIKPGGIIIDPEDALPSKRGELYKGTSKHNEEYYYQYLHPKAGVINVVVESEANRDQEKPLKSKVEKPEVIEGPVREFDYQKTRVLDKENVKMGGSYKNSEDILLTKEDKDKLEKEHSRNQREVVRTGSILIDPEDVLPSMRESIHTDARTGATYANLKSDAQIREEQGGIIHNGASGVGIQEVDMEKPGPDTQEEPIKTGGILINPDDALPSMRESIHTDPHGGETYVQLKSGTQIREEQGGIVHAGGQQEKEKRSGRREPMRTGSILIDPEDVLPSMRESIHTDSRTGATYANLKSDAQIREDQGGIVHASGPQEVEKGSGMSQTKREPMRTGSILIDPEDVLPSMRESIHTDSRTGATYANLKSDTQIREEQGGIVHANRPQEVEKRSGRREPMRTGSILIDPEDVLPSMRESIHTDSRTGATYANLKSDAQIREEQGGIVHASGSREMEKRSGMTRTKREPIRSGSILIDPEDVLPSMRINVHRDPRTGKTYANLKSDTQIREQQGGIVHSREPIEGEQIKSSFSRNIDTSKTFSRQFSYEFTREMPYEDPIKTGGIIIRKEDALSYMKDNIHTDPHSGETYAMLKPWVQIKEEQAGITHLAGSSSGPEMQDNREEEKRAEPVLETRSEIKPGQEVDDKKMSRVHSRQFTLERERAIQEEDPIKTGGIVIDPEDALPMHRSEIRTDPRSRLSVASLKPWSQIQKEQAGIIHQGPLQEARDQQEKPKSSKRRRESVREEDRIINPEENQEVARDPIDESQCEIVHGSNQPRSEVARTREFDFVYTRTVQAEHIKRGQPTRFIEPENMLSWMKNEPEVQGLISGGEQESQPRHHREPIKTGSILIKPEDVLPTEMDKLHTDPKTGETYANLKSDFEIREQQGGIVHAPEPQTVERESQIIDIARDPRAAEEKKSSQSSVRFQGSRNFCYEYEPLKARSQEEPIKTGGIVINRDDALPAHRESVLKDPHSSVTYVALKPWNQIQKEQNGVIHSSTIHHKASDDVLLKESSRVQRRHKREITSEQWKNNENNPIRRPENIISQDKENISTVANFKKSSHAQGEFSKSYSIPLDEAGLGGENADSDKEYFTKQAEDRSKWVHLNDKVDSMLRKSRVILGESNTTPNII